MTDKHKDQQERINESHNFSRNSSKEIRHSDRVNQRNSVKHDTPNQSTQQLFDKKGKDD